MTSQLLNQIIESHKNVQDNTNNYNIFQVLQLESEEVRLHSRFLADLLNPLGNHGQRSFFLKSFLGLVKENTIFPDLNRVEVHVEKYVGVVTATTGGQIDILLIDNHNNALIIENKIYAGDQPNQLLRYRNFGKQLQAHGGQFHIVYLTLHGNCASDFSLGKEMTHDEYECLSYKQSITHWLEDCNNILSANAKTSIILTHYIQLLKNLTGMENDKQQSLTVNEILQSKEHFDAAEKITNAIYPAKYHLLKVAIDDIVNQLQPEYPDLKFHIAKDFGYQYKGLEIHHTTAKENEHPSHIRFSFLGYADNCYIEIHPGLKNGVAIDKNHEKRLYYTNHLSPHFPKTSGSISSTENSWQGEWVMYYKAFNNKFQQLLDKEIRPTFLYQVSNDLRVIIDAFINAESQFDVRL